MIIISENWIIHAYYNIKLNPTKAGKFFNPLIVKMMPTRREYFLVNEISRKRNSIHKLSKTAQSGKRNFLTKLKN